ncbi:hypothetical protein [Flexithrix dorotheae]|uniref:hypothetical protein n=1 Tax=Flexithrix dorotheae TaxID=70993 RepID=UPI00037B9507|nr:hypothetical protein [Flexithrix dorotheae]
MIERLKHRIDFTFLKIVDYWPSDLCAIGIQKENKLVYISTFNLMNKEELKYDFDLELIEGSKINVLKEEREVSEKKLIFELKAFFQI